MPDTTLDELAGVTLRTRDPDQRGIGLALLTRLATVLNLRLDDLVFTHEPAPRPARPARAGDDITLLALLAYYRGLATERVLAVLGWDPERLGAALATIGAHLAPTALRVAATDHRLTLTLRPGALPEPLRERFDAEQSLRHPLEPGTAVELLKLVHDKILAPFPDDGRFPGEEERPARGHTWTEDFLIRSRLAIDAEPQGGDPGTPAVQSTPT